MEFSALMNKMAIFVVLMLIGYFLSRNGTLDSGFTRSASKLVLNVFMVGTILSSMISTGAERDLSNLPEIILLTFLTTFIGYLAAFLITRFVHVTPDHSGTYEILMGVGNTMFIALPIAEAIYGAYAVFIVSLSCIPFNVFLYSYGVWRIKGNNQRGKIQIKEFFSVPLVATMLGLVIVLLGIPVPGSIRGVLSSLSGATMPMSMIVIGASLGSVSLLDAFKKPKLALLSAVRLVVIPIITWLICRLLTSDSALLMTCMINAAAPSAVIITVIISSLFLLRRVKLLALLLTLVIATGF